MSEPKPAFMGAKSYGKGQWPTYISRHQKDAYESILSRGLTQEEVSWYKVRGNWENGKPKISVTMPEAA